MSKPSPDDDPRFAEIVTLIKSLTVPERERLFKVLEYQRRLFDEAGYTILPRSIVDMLMNTFKTTLDMSVDTSKRLGELKRQLARRQRPLDKVRLEGGKIILQANRDGISWKKMPSHVLKTYPDWFPQYRERRPSTEEHK